jgi:NAD(P)-dependent dehydrogenase (short-subunit alcohol dehydrogenase family)
MALEYSMAEGRIPIWQMAQVTGSRSDSTGDRSFLLECRIFIDGGVNTPDADWKRILDVNVMAHIYAARAVLPGMLARGEGYLLQTVSAAGLLTSIGSAPYAVSKHAALALAEWIAITHGDEGIKVSVICPQGVRTNIP